MYASEKYSLRIANYQGFGSFRNALSPIMLFSSDCRSQAQGNKTSSSTPCENSRSHGGIHLKYAAQAWSYDFQKGVDLLWEKSKLGKLASSWNT